METLLARKMMGTMEPFPAMIFFAPEAEKAWERLGFDQPGQGYFASRAAPMGAVDAGTVKATFYNFNPRLIDRSIPAAWAAADPATVLEARHEAVDNALQRLLGDETGSDEMRWAADVAGRAASACPLDGRPLFAAHQALGEPDAVHVRLWHNLTLLREFRGDGHIAALLAADVSGVQSLVLHAAMGRFDTEFLRRSRGWSGEEWSTAEDRLRSRGWLAMDGALTDEGREAREAIEVETDRMAMAPWRAIGQEDADRLRATLRPWSRAIAESGDRPAA